MRLGVKVYTVSGINAYLKDLIENTPVIQHVAVSGELSNYKIHPTGHHYFTLKDADCTLKCVMFRSAAARLRFRPESGMLVTAVGRIGVYPQGGVYQLYADRLLPEGTGELQLAFEALKEKLEREGLFREANKKPIPKYPARICLITSPVGAAVRDMLRILGARWPAASVVLIPVKVQGAGAAEEIAAAIRLANEERVADLIITGRGGGSMEDLWCFNEEITARAIASSKIPVISAVGHEPDVTIADYAADLRAATPSNGAELAVPDWRDVSQLIDSRTSALCSAMERVVQRRRNELLRAASSDALRDPAFQLKLKRGELEALTARFERKRDTFCEEKREELANRASRLDALSPLRVLQRGYAAAQREDGSFVRSASELPAGKTFHLRLQDGVVDCVSNGRMDET